MDLVAGARIGKVIFGGSVITERLHIDVKQDLKKKKKASSELQAFYWFNSICEIYGVLTSYFVN